MLVPNGVRYRGVPLYRRENLGDLVTCNAHSSKQYTTVYPRISQYTTLHHSTSQYITVYYRISQYTTLHHSTSQYITAHWNILISRGYCSQLQVFLYLSIGMTTSFLHVVLPQLPPRKTSQNGGGGGEEGGEGQIQSPYVHV